MKNTFFNSDKPQTESHIKYMGDFISGYEATAEKLKTASFESVRDEFNLIHKGTRQKSMGAYFYAKGEFACIMDNAQ